MMSTDKGLKLFEKLQYQLIRNIEKHSSTYRTLTKRPKTVSGLTTVESSTAVTCDSAIILQGQLVHTDHFTLETVRMYQKLYPGLLVIISTWKNEDPDLIEQLRKEENCEVVLSDYPEYSGLLNLNYQVTSTLAGLNKAKACGKKYVLKSRCDYRFYKKRLFEYLYCLITEYPLDPSITYQKYRIVAGAEVMNSMFRPFWLADQFNYGYIDDMLLYWNYQCRSVRLSKNEVQSQLEQEQLTWNQRTEKRLAAEPDIVLDFFRRCEGKIPELSVSSYWDRLKRQFILVSRRELEAYWMKYEYKYDESASNGIYYEDDDEKKCLTYNWDFSLWLLLYHGLIEHNESCEQFSNENRYGM